MLLFNFSLTTPSGDVRQEIVNVYSKHFETKVECEEFLTKWQWAIENKGVSSIQAMLKDGYKVKLNYVVCSQPGATLPKATKISNSDNPRG